MNSHKYNHLIACKYERKRWQIGSNGVGIYARQLLKAACASSTQGLTPAALCFQRRVPTIDPKVSTRQSENSIFDPFHDHVWMDSLGKCLHVVKRYQDSRFYVAFNSLDTSDFLKVMVPIRIPLLSLYCWFTET